jgi:hypothetical protein
MEISRPTIEIKSSPSGKKFTIEIASDTWFLTYQLMYPLPTEAEAKAAAKEFGSAFDAEATEVEAGTIPPYYIIDSLVADKVLKSRRKPSAKFDKFIKLVARK